MRLSATDLAHEVVPIDQLQSFPGNARLHDDALLDESIGEHGVYRTVVVSSDGYVIAGNGTWERAKEAGEELIAVTRLPLPHDDPQAIKINVVDNRANDKASNDADLLASLLTSIPDLAGTGYGQDDLAELLARSAPQGGLTDPDEVPSSIRPPRRSRS